jgi:hypothetical protein
MPAARVAGQPVYTLAVGLGTRLPLHGNLGASPASSVARLVPAPVTHWLLLALSMTAAALVVLRAIEPAGGRLIAWWSIALLLVSLPMVAYTVHNDWPETAVTYCALVGGMFAPHAWVAMRETGNSRRGLLQRIGLLALVASLLAIAHPGYWSQLAAAIGLSGLLLFGRQMRAADRWTALLGVGAAALAGVAIHLPDLAQEAALGAGLGRDSQGATDTLIAPHLFPWQSPGSKHPFMLVPLSVAALAAAAVVDRRWRFLVAGSALASIGFALAAVYLPVTALPLGAFAPTASWTLRDPAGVFAVMSGAFAATALVGGRPLRIASAAVTLVMLLASAQALGYAGALARDAPSAHKPWNHDRSDPEARTLTRGMPARVAAAGDRLALWPGVRADMRLDGRAGTDWVDAGQGLVTAWTKNRTTAQLVGANGYLFDQAIDLPPQVLCDAATVSFLRLRHLVVPPDQLCEGWVQTSARIDSRWSLAAWVAGEDPRVRAMPAASLTDGVREEPALTGTSTLMQLLVPQEGTVLEIDAVRSALRVSRNGASNPDQVLVLPVAYDPGWRVSSGRTARVGGLLAILGSESGELRAWFTPDTGLQVRAIGMAVAQALAVLGLLALGFGPNTRPNHNVA